MQSPDPDTAPSGKNETISSPSPPQEQSPPPAPPTSPLPQQSPLPQNSPPPSSPPVKDSPPPSPLPLPPSDSRSPQTDSQPPPPPPPSQPPPPPPSTNATKHKHPPPSPNTFSPPPPVSAETLPKPTLSPPLPPSEPTPGSLPLEKPAPVTPPASSGSNNTDSPPPSDNPASSQSVIIAGIVVSGLLALGIFIVCLLYWRRKKKDGYYADPVPAPPLKGKGRKAKEHIIKLPPAVNTSINAAVYGKALVLSPSGLGGFSKTQFTYEELATATCGFSKANVLGQGGFGYVHKGILADGRVVAVKSLKSGSGQGEREFQAEVEIISRVHHRHLVSLVGYCIANAQRMLVYEYVPNKTLDFHIHGKGRRIMDWATRLKLALGSAKGLAYLHEDCHPKIIHRDVKAANILLDDNFEAKVADFGLAKLSPDNFTHISTRVMGTFGYLAPEYASSGKLTDKSDVFSFGVVLLELITGKKPIDPSNIMEDSLVEWARPLLKRALEEGKYDELIGAPLAGNVVPRELHQLVVCAAATTRHSARRRPKMSQIVHALEGISSLEDLNHGAKPGQAGFDSDSYDTQAYRADMMKFRQMMMETQEFNSSELGATSEYGLNPSSSSDSDYLEFDRHQDGRQRIVH